MSMAGRSVDVGSGRRASGKRLGLLGLWIISCVLGCGEGEYVDGTMSYPVKGKVLLADGKPLTSGRIYFVSNETALTYGAFLDPNGAFEVKQNARIGAPEGTYKVRVEMVESSLPKGKRKSQAALPYAGRYTDEDASKLTATVKAGDQNTFEFKLEKK